MKTIFLTTLAAVALATGAAAQTALLQFNTFGNAGTETTEPSVANDPTVTASTLTLGAGISPATNGNRFGGTNFFDAGDTNPTTLAESITGNDYFQFVLTPTGGNLVTPTSFVFGFDHSATGPNSLTIRSSADGFATDLGTITGLAANQTNNNVIALNATTVTNLSAATTFRIYGYGATGTTGSGGFDTGSNAVNVTLNAGVLPAPEPSTYAMIFGGLGALGLVLRARRQIA